MYSIRCLESAKRCLLCVSVIRHVCPSTKRCPSQGCAAVAVGGEQGHCSVFWVEGEIMPVIAGGEHLPVWPAFGQLQRLHKPQERQLSSLKR